MVTLLITLSIALSFVSVWLYRQRETERVRREEVQQALQTRIIEDGALRARVKTIEDQLAQAQTTEQSLRASIELRQSELQRTQIELETTKSHLEHHNQALGQAQDTVGAQQETIDRLQRVLGQTQIELETTKSRLEHTTQALKATQEQSQSLSEGLRLQIKELATRVLKERSEALDQRSSEVLNPLREDLKRFAEQIQQSYSEEARQRFSLQNEIRLLMEHSQQIGKDATNLTQALRGNSKVQGDWGEMLLESLLERSGLVCGEHYTLQETLRDEEGRVIKTEDNPGGMRTDAIVRYPGGRGCIVIDSKVSLKAYASYMDASTDEERRRYAEEHVRSVRRHIQLLGSKEYWRHLEGTPSFVMLFIPIEPAYILALRTDPNLWDEAYRQNIVLINGSNLMAALRLTADIWQRDQQDKKVLQVLSQAEGLYDKCRLFVDSLLDVESRLDQASKALQGAKGQLHTGKGNIISRLERMQILGLKVKQRIALSSDEENSPADNFVESNDSSITS